MTEALLVLAALMLAPGDDDWNPDPQPNMWTAEHAIEIWGYRDNIPFASGDSVGASPWDLEFTAATEEWVASVDPGSTPKHIREAVAALGQDGWKAREKASKDLEAAIRAKPADARWLFPARRSKDAEIANRVNHVIRRLNACSYCRGTREAKCDREHPCPDCKKYGGWACNMLKECGRCDSIGTSWRRGAWD